MAAFRPALLSSYAPPEASYRRSARRRRAGEEFVGNLSLVPRILVRKASRAVTVVERHLSEGGAMNEGERLDGLEPISPELVLCDPTLAARVRASSVQGVAPSALVTTSRPHGRRLRGLLASTAVTAILGGAVAAGILAGPTRPPRSTSSGTRWGFSIPRDRRRTRR